MRKSIKYYKDRAKYIINLYNQIIQYDSENNTYKIREDLDYLKIHKIVITLNDNKFVRNNIFGVVYFDIICVKTVRSELYNAGFDSTSMASIFYDLSKRDDILNNTFHIVNEEVCKFDKLKSKMKSIELLHTQYIS